MAHWRDFTSMQSKYLCAADLKRPTSFILKGIEEEEVGRDKELKPVVKLEGPGAKPWILNKTNIKSLAKLFGDDLSNWLERKVTLYAKKDIEVDGETKAGIRVQMRPEIQKPTKPPVEVDLNDSIPDFGNEPPPIDEDGNPV